MLTSAPFDDWWHNTYGLDVTILSPPHTVLLLGMVTIQFGAMITVLSVKNRMNAQSSCAAQFIYWHIEDTDAKWCHIDLAGPAFPSNRATGYGVALVAEMVRSLAK